MLSSNQDLTNRTVVWASSSKFRLVCFIGNSKIGRSSSIVVVVVVVVIVVSLRENKQAMKQVLLRSNGHIGYF